MLYGRVTSFELKNKTCKCKHIKSGPIVHINLDCAVRKMFCRGTNFYLMVVCMLLMVSSLIIIDFAFLSSILFRYGYFSGINRKVQFKYLGKPRDGSESESSESRLTDSGSDEKSGKQKVGKEAKTKDSKEGTGQSSEESQENEETKDEKLKVPVDSEHALLLIVKWGGELTTMGKEQALQLGRAFRYIYMK